MRFDVVEDTRHPREVVFSAHKDRLLEIVPFLEDVEKIELRGRASHADGREEQTHLWYGSPSVVPALVRPMVPPHLLQWLQKTVWSRKTWTAEWTIDVPGLGGTVEASGRNVYVEAGGKCRIEVSGDFAFRPEKVKELAAVPASVVPMVEKIVVGLIVPLVQRTGVAVSRFLDEEAKKRAAR